MVKHLKQAFIEKANAKHNSRYTYNNVFYKNSHIKVLITCCLHGDFAQTPTSHLSGSGCPICGDKVRRDNIRKPLSVFVKKANSVHNNKYDYSNVYYETSHKKISIRCTIHDVYFEMLPSNHLKGKGCRLCSNIKLGECNRNSVETFIEKATKLHGNKYDYSLVEYKSYKNKVKIVCKEHGVFEQLPLNHLRDKGCPSCTTFGFDKNKPATLYYLKINNGQAYKIGITNRRVDERFKVYDLESIEVLKCWEYAHGEEAYKTEQKILKEYSAYKYVGKNLLSSGNTELFTIDILGLDF